jgi:hypothetical protein
VESCLRDWSANQTVLAVEALAAETQPMSARLCSTELARHMR